MDKTIRDVMREATVLISNVEIFRKVVHHIKHVNRFSLTPELSAFVDTRINFCCEYCTAVSRKGTVFYRARINEKEYRTKPYETDKMTAPSIGNATSGRINPEGIAYLYCSDKIDTAISEVSPWVKASLTIAKVELKEDLSFIDLTKKDVAQNDFFHELFSYAFTAPWEPDEKLNYIVTQFFAEQFKGKGFDGIVYSSGKDLSGKNIAIFRLDSYEIKEPKLVTIDDVKYVYSQPYSSTPK